MELLDGFKASIQHNLHLPTTQTNPHGVVFYDLLHRLGRIRG